LSIELTIRKKKDVARGKRIEIYFSRLGKEWKTTEEERGTADTASHSSGATRTRGLLIYTHTRTRVHARWKKNQLFDTGVSIYIYIYMRVLLYIHKSVFSKRRLEDGG